MEVFLNCGSSGREKSGDRQVSCAIFMTLALVFCLPAFAQDDFFEDEGPLPDLTDSPMPALPPATPGGKPSGMDPVGVGGPRGVGPGVGRSFQSPGMPNRSAAHTGLNQPSASSKITSKKSKEKLSKASLEEITNENYPEVIESFDFPNADITDVIKAISELTGKNFILDRGVSGKITIIAPSKITVAEAYKAFLSALATNNLAVVPTDDGFYKIRPGRSALRDRLETYSGDYFPNSDQMITKIAHLQHINISQVFTKLRSLVTGMGEMLDIEGTNSLIISDYGANVDRIVKIITQLDVPGFEDQLEVIRIRYARAKEIAELVDRIVNRDGGSKRSGASGGSSFSAGVSRFSRAQGNQQGSSYFMVIPEERTNSLIATGNKPGLARLRGLISQLDFKLSPEDSGGVYVYYVKFGEAEKIRDTLSGVTKDAAPAKPGGGGPAGGLGVSPTSGPQVSQEIFGGDVKITADKTTNALVITASKQDYEVVLRILGQIDIPRDQVFVEAVILEMKITDALNWRAGVMKFTEQGVRTGFSGFPGSGSGSLADLLTPTGGTGAILGFGSQDIIEVKTPGTSSATPFKINSVLGLVNFLKKNAQANVLSTPQILALDNQEAEISVGDRVVTGSNLATSTVAGQPAIQSPTFDDATISLKVKPFISPASNTIRMELEQNIKQLSAAKTPPAFENQVQPLATRKIKTNIVVNNGDTVVLGGLMKEDDFEEISKVPLLGDIPIIGWLFKSRVATREKTNMLVFLTPKIIRTRGDSKELVTKKMDQRLDYIKSIGGRDPYGKTADEIIKSAKDFSEAPIPPSRGSQLEPIHK